MGTDKGTPTVRFNIEVRPATSGQVDAGKRLFSRLLSRVQESSSRTDSSKQKHAVGAAGRRLCRRPPPAPHPLSGGQNLHAEKEEERKEEGLEIDLGEDSHV